MIAGGPIFQDVLFPTIRPSAAISAAPMGLTSLVEEPMALRVHTARLGECWTPSKQPYLPTKGQTLLSRRLHDTIPEHRGLMFQVA
jgi:hypothetical protein